MHTSLRSRFDARFDKQTCGMARLGFAFPYVLMFPPHSPPQQSRGSKARLHAFYPFAEGPVRNDHHICRVEKS
ncbi:hypothetical protein FJTKL_02658 [Diaporthe vaccinii]|uniref:Uncharacterized protein n=1 Tax=Diaporthe vaccinii TaxID=105482 RepID=A0ABR4DXM7_9PEZI